MPKYEIGFTIETWHSVVVEAEDSVEAIEKFHSEGLAWDKGSTLKGEYLQEDVDYRELVEVRNA